jgi:hypothetical protein
VVRRVGGGCALCVVGFQAAAQVGPGVAAGPWAGWAAAELVEMGIQGTLTSLGQAAVRLPHPGQSTHEVAALRFVWKACDAWPEQSHTVTR